MFKNSSQLIFLSFLILGTFITISANSWFGAWMGLEINLLSFIPLMNNDNNLLSSESALKYFLTQTLASSVLLFSVLMLLTFYNLNWNLMMNFVNHLILSALLLKTGAAPFHFWFPGVMEGLSWMNNLLLMTWQKMAPLMMISYYFSFNFIVICIVLSTIIGSMGGLNQTSFRKLMAFSSINHLGWMLAAMMFNETLWFMYFLFYTFLTFSIVYMFHTFKLYHLNQTFSNYLNNPIIKFCIFLNLLSLGGLPPFLGFLPKWIVIQNLTNMNQLTLMIIMVSFTLVALYFYLRICYAAYMLNYNKISWILTNNYISMNYMITISLNFIAIAGLFIISLFYFIL